VKCGLCVRVGILSVGCWLFYYASKMASESDLVHLTVSVVPLVFDTLIDTL